MSVDSLGCRKPGTGGSTWVENSDAAEHAPIGCTGPSQRMAQLISSTLLMLRNLGRYKIPSFSYMPNPLKHLQTEGYTAVLCRWKWKTWGENQSYFNFIPSGPMWSIQLGLRAGNRQILRRHGKEDLRTGPGEKRISREVPSGWPQVPLILLLLLLGISHSKYSPTGCFQYRGCPI